MHSCEVQNATTDAYRNASKVETQNPETGHLKSTAIFTTR